MHLIYLDESGNTGALKDPAQPHHMIAGLIVHESAVRPIERAVAAISVQHFGAAAQQPDFELHGADLYGGNGHFKGVAPATRIACVEDVLAELQRCGAKVVWSMIDKFKLTTTRHPHQLAFLFLAERVEDWLSRQGSLGLFVADENREIEQRLIDDLEQFKLTGTAMGWRPTTLNSIIDSIHFVQSKNNKLIQCVDLIAYFALKDMRQQIDMSDNYLALSGPRIPYAAWKAAYLTRKKQVIDDLGRKIAPFTVARKKWP